MREHLMVNQKPWYMSFRRLFPILSVLAILAAASFPTASAQAGYISLTGKLPGYVGIYQVQISPDSNWVIYIADADDDDVRELYRVPITGGEPLKLNPPLVSGGDVFRFQISEDSTYLVYDADQEVDERREIFRVPLTGGSVTKLNSPLVSGGNVSSWEMYPSSGRLVYIADQESNDVYELYSVPLEGGAATKLNSAMPADGDTYIFDYDPVSGRVVYSAEQENGSLYEIYSVPVAGGSIVKLTPPLAQSVLTFQITPGISYVMYIARESGQNTYGLYGNDIPGGAPRKRNYTLGPGENVLSFRINPTATQVVYTVGSNNKYQFGNLWRTSPYAGSSQQLSETPDLEYGVESYDFQFTPDGNRLVYRYKQGMASVTKLQSVYVSGGPLNRADLYVPPDTDNYPSLYRISPDGSWVAFQVYTFSSSTSYIHTIPAFGGNMLYFGSGNDPQISPDSQRLIFVRQDPFSELSDLISTQIFGGDQRNLTKHDPNNYAYSHIISPDGNWIVFDAQINNGAAYEIRVSDGAEPLPTYDTFIPLMQK